MLNGLIIKLLGTDSHIHNVPYNGVTKDVNNIINNKLYDRFSISITHLLAFSQLHVYQSIN